MNGSQKLLGWIIGNLYAIDTFDASQQPGLEPVLSSSVWAQLIKAAAPVTPFARACTESTNYT
jgi:hypothetical protein